jgi:hypothetical protein
MTSRILLVGLLLGLLVFGLTITNAPRATAHGDCTLSKSLTLQGGAIVRAAGLWSCNDQHAETRVLVILERPGDDLWFTQNICLSCRSVQAAMSKSCNRDGNYSLRVEGKSKNAAGVVVHAGAQSVTKFFNCP